MDISIALKQAVVKIIVARLPIMANPLLGTILGLVVSPIVDAVLLAISNELFYITVSHLAELDASNLRKAQESGVDEEKAASELISLRGKK